MMVNRVRRSLLVRLAKTKLAPLVVKQHSGGWLVSCSNFDEAAKSGLAELGIHSHTPHTVPPLFIPLDADRGGGRRVPRHSLYPDQVYVSEDDIHYYFGANTFDQVRVFFTDEGDFYQPAVFSNGKCMHPVSLINRDAPLVEFYRWTCALNRRMAIHTAIAEGGTITQRNANQLGGNVRLTIAAEQLFEQGYAVGDAFGELIERGLLDTYKHPGASYVRMLSLASTHFYAHPTHLVTRDGLKNPVTISEL